MDGLWANGSKAPGKLIAVRPSCRSAHHSSCPPMCPNRARLTPFSFRPSQAIDTGTSLIYVPPALASAFYGLIPGSKHASQYGPGPLSLPTARLPAKGGCTKPVAHQKGPPLVFCFLNRFLDRALFLRQERRALVRRISLRDQRE
jgi:hypothetical protein